MSANMSVKAESCNGTREGSNSRDEYILGLLGHENRRCEYHVAVVAELILTFC